MSGFRRRAEGELRVQEVEVGKEPRLVVVPRRLPHRALGATSVVPLRHLGIGLTTPDAALMEEACQPTFLLTAVVGEQRFRGLGQPGQTPT